MIRNDERFANQSPAVRMRSEDLPGLSRSRGRHDRHKIADVFASRSRARTDGDHARARARQTGMTSSSDPTVLWRMSRGRSTAHATIFPGDAQTTVTWFFDGVMDRAENYDSLDLAMARADEIRGILLKDGWKEA